MLTCSYCGGQSTRLRPGAGGKMYCDLHLPGRMNEPINPHDRVRLTDRVDYFKSLTSEEEQSRLKTARLIERYPNPFARVNHEGHVVGSALVISSDSTCILLGFHKKLGKWLHLGGHGEEGENDPSAIALREVSEETGRPPEDFEWITVPGHSGPELVDIDVHAVPQRGDVPGHDHCDLRYVLRLKGWNKITMNPDEHESMHWFGWGDLQSPGLQIDDSLRRLIGKAYLRTMLLSRLQAEQGS